MNLPDTIELEKRIFTVTPDNFNKLALDIFKFQYEYNTIYQKYCGLLHANPSNVTSIIQIPFLPISFFKTHEIKTGNFEAATIFESSGTTAQINSKHFIKSVSLYKKSFINGFNHFFGNAENYCLLALLPSYLEKGNSSLVFMTDELIRLTNNELSGFFLTDFERLHNTILSNEIKRKHTILLGVTYALLDFFEQYPMQLKYTHIIETGGMKGRKEEMTRQQVHAILKQQTGLNAIQSEYGMTELLSQAYSLKDGIFTSTTTMKILIREEDDPLKIVDDKHIKNDTITGCINIIDLSNIYSCSFIATDDIGKLFKNGSFEVLGRLDNSDIRGCSLLTI